MGVAGSAMGSVAIAARNMGFDVLGSDTAVYAPMSHILHSHGIRWYNGYSEQNIMDATPDLVVVGNAISRGNAELEYVLDQRLPITSMASFVATHLIGRSKSIVVAGTHGKTSTSSMLTWMLDQAGRAPGFLIGGAPRSFDVSCRPCRAGQDSDHNEIFVVEGDEYDTAYFDKRSKFVHYRPWHFIINNIEFDHADIFTDLESIVQSFVHGIRLVPRSGIVLVNADDANAMRAVHQAKPLAAVQTVGTVNDATWQIADVDRSATHSEWSLLHGGNLHGRFRTAEAGLHSIRNASMAIASTSNLGVDAASQSRSLESLLLPKRRLEELGSWKGRIVVDDFAHHPTAILVTIDAVRQRYPSRRICAVFEPRSNTSTRSIFQLQFEQCFSAVTALILGPVNRAERYAPNERLDVESIVGSYRQRGIPTHAVNAASLQGAPWGASVLPFLEEMSAEGDVVLLLSNGNVGGLREVLLQGYATSE